MFKCQLLCVWFASENLQDITICRFLLHLFKYHYDDVKQVKGSASVRFDVV